MREFRPGSFQILPTIIKNLIIINVLVFLVQQTMAHSSNPTFMEDNFALHAWQSPLFKPWQLVTHLFMHGNIPHIAFNMLALWMFGSTLENVWGPKRFLTFYIVCGLGAAFCHMIVLYFETENLLNHYYALKANFDINSFTDFYNREHLGNDGDISEFLQQWRVNPGNSSFGEQAVNLVNSYVNNRLNEPTLGASGAVFGCLAAFGYLFPNTLIYIYFFLPLKAKWFVLIYAGIELVMALQNSAGDNVAHVAHLGGAIFGIALVYFWNKNNKRNFY